MNKLLLIFSLLFSISCAQEAKSIDIQSNKFIVYDALLFDNKPVTGLHIIKNVARQREFFDGGKPSEIKTRKIAASKPSSLEQDIYYLNVEFLPTDTIYSTILDLSESMVSLTSIAKWFKDERHSLTVGYYGILPERQYWNTTPAWKERNTYFIPLASHVDYIAPSLYTFYDDQLGWVKYAIENIKEARKYGKPVYPFIWPQYHQSSVLAGQLIPGDYWRLQLNTIKKYADGVIIWGGWQVDWNESTSETDPNNWWYQTLDFMQ